MCDIAHDFSLQQLVREPTRSTHTLDLLLTNNPDSITGVKVVDDGLPGVDHDAVDSVLKVAQPQSSAEKRIVYDFKKADFEQLIPWPPKCYSLGHMFVGREHWRFMAKIQRPPICSSRWMCIPKATLQKRRKKTWLGDETLRMIRRKRRAYKVMKHPGRDSDIRRYRALSTTVRELTRNDHCLYLEEITKDLHMNQKPFWRWLKNMRRSPRTIPDLHHQGQTLSSLTEKVKAFHSYFLTVFTREDARNVEFLCFELVPRRSTEYVEDMLFSEDEVFKALNLIDPSKACGPDCIPGRLLKEGAPWLSEPLVPLFNQSLKSGQLPSDWTSANVTPVHKKGSKHDPKNYRPVSLTSIVVKIMKRLVHGKIANFLNASQHRFRSGHSCIPNPVAGDGAPMGQHPRQTIQFTCAVSRLFQGLW